MRLISNELGQYVSTNKGATFNPTSKEQPEIDEPVDEEIVDALTCITGSYTTDFGNMTLKVEGNKVTGNYDFSGGTIAGTLNGSELMGKWTQTSSAGNFKFEFMLDCSSFKGVWGYTGGAVNAGIWNGKKM